MGLVGADDVSSLSVHGGYVVLITSIEFVHLANQIVPLLSDHAQVLFKAPFLVLGIQSTITHHVQLVVELTKAMYVALVLCL